MKYMIIGLFLLFAGNIYAQVRGTVKDSTGEAIPGANVFWMNTGQGVTTKEDGSFSITKPSKSHMLIVSFIGFHLLEGIVTEVMDADRVDNTDKVPSCSKHVRYRSPIHSGMLHDDSHIAADFS